MVRGIIQRVRLRRRGASDFSSLYHRFGRVRQYLEREIGTLSFKQTVKHPPDQLIHGLEKRNYTTQVGRIIIWSNDTSYLRMGKKIAKPLYCLYKIDFLLNLPPFLSKADSG